MKKGKVLTVTGASARGTKTTDTYSLSGISAALAAIDKDDRHLTSTRRQIDTNAAALDCHRLLLEIVARERGEPPAP